MQKTSIRSSFNTKVLWHDKIARIMSGGARQKFRVFSLISKNNGIAVGMCKHQYFFNAKQKIEKYKNDLKTYKININGSVHTDVVGRYKGTVVLIKKAKKGTGIISNGYMYEVLKACGYTNICVKLIRGNSVFNAVYALLNGLSRAQTYTNTSLYNKRNSKLEI